MNLAKMHMFAPVVLRFGLVALFLWFGLSQVTAPAAWTSWLPTWTSSLPIAPQQLVLLNGGFEVVFGVLLAIGYWTRLVALVLAIHLFVIAFEIGYNDIGVRDFVLGVCTFSLALFIPDRFTADTRRAPPSHGEPGAQ